MIDGDTKSKLALIGFRLTEAEREKDKFELHILQHIDECLSVDYSPDDCFQDADNDILGETIDEVIAGINA